MADLVTGALVSYTVEKLLTKVLRAASLAYNHDKYCTELHSLLMRLQPLALKVSARMDGGDTAARKWVQSLCEELEKAVKILEERSQEWKIVSSKRIVGVMQRIGKLVQEVGLVGVAAAQGTDSKVGRVSEEVRDYFETLSAQVASLQEQLRSVEQLSVATRNAFLTPVCNYGHSVGITSAGAALSEIKGSADSAMWAAAAAATSQPRDGAGAAVAVEANPKLRRQYTQTVFGGSEVVEQLQKVLLSEDPSIRWVGVWATGGAGKTFTAERLYNSPALQTHFTDGTFWLTVGRDRSTRKLLEELFTACIHRQPAGVFSDEDFKNRLCQELGNKKNAVLFLDDVWIDSHLDWLDVLPREGKNRIFVTTRNKDLLQRKQNAKLIEIQMMSVEDSWKLFCWYAFGGADKILADLEGIAREVVDECKGLPLALRVIGSIFAGKTEPIYWQRSLEKLKAAEILSPMHEEQLFLRLKLSLDDLQNLDSRLIDCFLYFAAFPEDAQVRVMEDLLDAWVGEGIVQGGKHAYDDAFELLGWLIARSLVELQGSKIPSYLRQIFMTCKVHDVLRDLARYVLQHGKEPHARHCLYESGRNLECFPPEWITTNNCSELSACRLSLSFNCLTELPQQLKAPKLQVLLLRDNPLKELPSAFFYSFRGLKVLDLRNTAISKLPSLLGHHLKQLAVLNLSSCNNLEGIPDSTGEMRGLQRLDLSRCYKLSSLPSSLTKLTSLQILHVDFVSSKVWDDTAPTTSCICSISFAKKRAALKDVSRLTSLNSLRIDGAKATEFSIKLNSLTKLESLDVCFEKAESLSEVGELQNLEAFSLWKCESLGSLPTSMERLARLKKLDLSLCKSLSVLPALDRLPHLQVLNLTDCSGLRYLPSSFACAGAFPALKELSLKGCRGLADFPALEAGAMPQLVMLSLSKWDQLTTSLPQPLQQLNKLRTLDAGHCIFLQSLDESLDLLSLSSLEELDLRSCQVLSSLPASLASLPSLKTLNIKFCMALHIPDELLQLETENRLEIIR